MRFDKCMCLCSPHVSHDLFFPFSLLAPGRLFWGVQMRRRRADAGSRREHGERTTGPLGPASGHVSNRAKSSQAEMQLFSPSFLRSWCFPDPGSKKATRPAPMPGSGKGPSQAEEQEDRQRTQPASRLPGFSHPNGRGPAPLFLQQCGENGWHVGFSRSQASRCPEEVSPLRPDQVAHKRLKTLPHFLFPCPSFPRGGQSNL